MPPAPAAALLSASASALHACKQKRKRKKSLRQRQASWRALGPTDEGSLVSPAKAKSRTRRQASERDLVLTDEGSLAGPAKDCLTERRTGERLTLTGQRSPRELERALQRQTNLSSRIQWSPEAGVSSDPNRQYRLSCPSESSIHICKEQRNRRLDATLTTLNLHCTPGARKRSGTCREREGGSRSAG